MSTYLLLRDNKQSGPYSLSEIQTKGFKKYDLVWIEGKSAAWRYPDEVPELKPFAPIVEEQPFDRFFKKPSEQNKETNTLRYEPVKKEMAKTVTTVTENKAVVEIGDKKVYAALPAKINPVHSQPQIILIKPSSPIKEEIKKPVTEPTVNDYFQEKETQAIEGQNTSQPKEKYLSKKNDRRRYLQPIALAACIVALLGAGIFIGMSISKNPSANISNDANEKQIAKINKPEPQNVSIPISTTVPTEEKKMAIDKENENLNGTVNAVAGSKSNDTKVAFISENKRTIRPKAADIPEPTKIAAQRENILDSNSSTGLVTRQSTHRTDAVNDKELVKNSIGNLVSVSSNKYNVGTFGGISEVQLTLNNRSNYPLDLVMVEVQYVQANKKVYKTENIYYKNVRPGEAMMQEAPKSSRGIKIEYKVTLINSKESSVTYSGI